MEFCGLLTGLGHDRKCNRLPFGLVPVTSRPAVAPADDALAGIALEVSFPDVSTFGRRHCPARVNAFCLLVVRRRRVVGQLLLRQSPPAPRALVGRKRADFSPTARRTGLVTSHGKEWVGGQHISGSVRLYAEIATVLPETMVVEFRFRSHPDVPTVP